MAKKIKQIETNNHILSVITPIGIEWNPSHFYFNDNLARVLIITKYPTRANIGWLSKIANMEGITCSIHLTPTESGKLIENISRSIGELGGRINNGGSALMMQRAEQQYKDANTLLRKIDQEQENVFYVTITLMVTGRDREDLDRRTKKLESALAGKHMRGRTVMFHQEDALKAVSPYGECPEIIKEISSRNMPVSSIAGAFPFNASGINDGSGMIFGKENGGGLILLDHWLRGGDRTNTNWTILGAPGVGKSQTVKHILLWDYALSSKVIIIDPEREYKEMCESLGGQWINCGGGKGGKINPLQVKVIPKDDEDNETNGKEDILYKDEGNGMGPLALHFQTLRTFFKLYIKSLNDDLQASLEEILEELYGQKGITWNTDVSTIPNEQYPIMRELWELCTEWSQAEEVNLFTKETMKLSEKKRERYESLALKLRSIAVGADSGLWNGHTTIQPDSDFIVLDTKQLEDADDSIKRTQYFNILTWAWQQLSNDRDEKVLLAVDEAYLIVDPDVPQGLQYLRNISKRIRKYEGGLLVISHSVVDFLDPAVRRHGQALLDNPCFKFFMGTDGKNLEELTTLMNLTEAEQDMLAKKLRGHGLLVVGNERLHAKVELDDFESEIFGKGGGK